MKKEYQSTLEGAPVSLRIHSHTLKVLCVSIGGGACRGYSYRSNTNQNRLYRMDKAVFYFYAYPKFPVEVIVVVGDSVRQNQF